ncbi:MAG: 5-oxoprolinase subunit PxpA [Microbacterium sp.]
MASSIDLNSDLGEGFGAWGFGDDAAMLDLVTSANVAAGFHAGDPAGILDTLRAAAERGVCVGAHVGYRDLAGFGRRAMDVTPRDLQAETIYQIGAVSALAAVAGTRVAYVKPHGALYNAIVHDEKQAAAVVAAVRAVDPGLAVVGLPGSAVLRRAEAAGLRCVREAFADRGYRADGTLVPRGSAGALVHDPAHVAERVVRMVGEGVVFTPDEARVTIDVDSICVHGDTPGSVEVARAVRAALDAAGIAVRSVLHA